MDNLLRQVLRIGREPCEYLDELQVHRLLTERPLEYYRFVKEGLRNIAMGRLELEMPPKQVFSDMDDAGDFRLMPCIVRDAGTTRKTVKIVGTNIRQQLVPNQITVGKVFVLHPQENFISHIVEACLLSSARTGICAAIATEMLAKKRKRVMFIGAGRVSYYAGLYIAALGGVEEIIFYDIDRQRADLTAALLAKQLKGLRVQAVGEKESAGETDLLVLATTSTTPVCRPPGMGAGLIISLGADTDCQHELDDAWVGEADIFVDSKDSGRFGDLKQWQDKELMTPADFVDLSELFQGKGELSERPKIFISTGSAVFDNLTVGYLLETPHP